MHVYMTIRIPIISILILLSNNEAITTTIMIRLIMAIAIIHC